MIQVEGVVNKVAKDSSLEKINDAVLRQGLFGRLLHFGDLSILTASDTTVDDFKMLNDATNFKKAMLNAKYALEREVAAPMPSPPLRAPSTSAEGSTAPAATAGAAPAGAAEPTAPPPAAPRASRCRPRKLPTRSTGWPTCATAERSARPSTRRRRPSCSSGSEPRRAADGRIAESRPGESR